MDKSIDIHVGKSISEGLKLKVQFQLSAGEFHWLTGPSGSGKTSLLRILAGLSTPDSGRITCDKDIWFQKDTKTNVDPNQRGIGFQFQQDDLFPNMTCERNLRYAMQPPMAEHYDDILKGLEILYLVDRKPGSLSGGEKQRVSLARAMLSSKNMMLLDEPLAHLNESLKLKILNFILELQRKTSITTLMVTHQSIQRFSSNGFWMKGGEMAPYNIPTPDSFASKAYETQVIDGIPFIIITNPLGERVKIEISTSEYEALVKST